MVKAGRRSERRYRQHSFVLISDLHFHHGLSPSRLKIGGSTVRGAGRISAREAQTLIAANELGSWSLPTQCSLHVRLLI